eukprot:GHVN01003105.1.p1 GENE.GHVN01003105.1~~GHVN01003105.1.p1  ORF type:complete len:1088 (-),score=212.97 GHVN01003105.1:400-3354(-)
MLLASTIARPASFTPTLPASPTTLTELRAPRAATAQLCEPSTRRRCVVREAGKRSVTPPSGATHSSRIVKSVTGRSLTPPPPASPPMVHHIKLGKKSIPLTERVKNKAVIDGGSRGGESDMVVTVTPEVDQLNGAHTHVKQVSGVSGISGMAGRVTHVAETRIWKVNGSNEIGAVGELGLVSGSLSRHSVKLLRKGPRGERKQLDGGEEGADDEAGGGGELGVADGGREKGGGRRLPQLGEKRSVSNPTLAGCGSASHSPHSPRAPNPSHSSHIPTRESGEVSERRVDEQAKSVTRTGRVSHQLGGPGSPQWRVSLGNGSGATPRTITPLWSAKQGQRVTPCFNLQPAHDVSLPPRPSDPLPNLPSPQPTTSLISHTNGPQRTLPVPPTPYLSKRVAPPSAAVRLIPSASPRVMSPSSPSLHTDALTPHSHLSTNSRHHSDPPPSSRPTNTSPAGVSHPFSSVASTYAQAPTTPPAFSASRSRHHANSLVSRSRSGGEGSASLADVGGSVCGRRSRHTHIKGRRDDSDVSLRGEGGMAKVGSESVKMPGVVRVYGSTEPNMKQCHLSGSHPDDGRTTARSSASERGGISTPVSTTARRKVRGGRGLGKGYERLKSGRHPRDVHRPTSMHSDNNDTVKCIAKKAEPAMERERATGVIDVTEIESDTGELIYSTDWVNGTLVRYDDESLSKVVGNKECQSELGRRKMNRGKQRRDGEETRRNSLKEGLTKARCDKSKGRVLASRSGVDVEGEMRCSELMQESDKQGSEMKVRGKQKAGAGGRATIEKQRLTSGVSITSSRGEAIGKGKAEATDHLKKNCGPVTVIGAVRVGSPSHPITPPSGDRDHNSHILDEPYAASLSIATSRSDELGHREPCALDFRTEEDYYHARAVYMLRSYLKSRGFFDGLQELHHVVLSLRNTQQQVTKPLTTPTGLTPRRTVAELVRLCSFTSEDGETDPEERELHSKLLSPIASSPSPQSQGLASAD